NVRPKTPPFGCGWLVPAVPPLPPCPALTASQVAKPLRWDTSVFTIRSRRPASTGDPSFHSPQLWSRRASGARRRSEWNNPAFSSDKGPAILDDEIGSRRRWAILASAGSAPTGQTSHRLRGEGHGENFL